MDHTSQSTSAYEEILERIERNEMDIVAWQQTALNIAGAHENQDDGRTTSERALMTNIIFSFGGGATSFLGALRLIEKHGPKNVTVLNCALIDDEPYVGPVVKAFEQVSGTKITRITYESPRLASVQRSLNATYAGEQSPALFKWLLEGIKRIHTPDWTVAVTDKPRYDVFSVFFLTALMGSSQRDPCSDLLKRKVLRKYITETHPGVPIAVGMTSDELDRELKVRSVWGKLGHDVIAPLADDTRYSDKEFVLEQFESLAGFIPASYKLGLRHNNCGLCVKSGFAEMARSLYYRPDIYARWEYFEALHQYVYEHPYTIMRKRKQVDGVVTAYPYSLKQFRLDMQEKWQNVLPGMEELLFFGLESSGGCSYCESAA